MKRVKPISSGTEALITAIWNYYGGPTTVRDKYFPNWNVQDFFNWRIRGKVPLKLVNIIASRLKIPKWGLNYEELSLMFPAEIPNWKEVVTSYKLPDEVVNTVLFYKPPKKYGKGI